MASPTRQRQHEHGFIRCPIPAPSLNHPDSTSRSGDQYLRIHLIDGAVAVSGSTRVRSSLTAGSDRSANGPMFGLKTAREAATTSFCSSMGSKSPFRRENPAGWGTRIGHARPTWVSLVPLLRIWRTLREARPTSTVTDSTLCTLLDEGSGDVAGTPRPRNPKAFGAVHCVDGHHLPPAHLNYLLSSRSLTAGHGRFTHPYPLRCSPHRSG